MHDMTNYLSTELHSICPGVRVESGTTSRHGGYVNSTRATTAGVLLRSCNEGQRLTVSSPLVIVLISHFPLAFCYEFCES